MRSGLFILKIALVSTAENIHMASTNKTAVLGGGSVGSTLAKALADADEDVVIAARDPARTAENLAWRNVSGIEGGAGRRRRPGIRVRDHTRDAERPRRRRHTRPGRVARGRVGEGRHRRHESPRLLRGKPQRPMGGRRHIRGRGPGIGPPRCQGVQKASNTVGVEHMRSALGKDMMIAGNPDGQSRTITEGVVKAVGFRPFDVGPIRYARNLEAIAKLWIHMAVPPLGARDASRRFWFSNSGNP